MFRSFAILIMLRAFWMTLVKRRSSWTNILGAIFAFIMFASEEEILSYVIVPLVANLLLHNLGPYPLQDAKIGRVSFSLVKGHDELH